MASPDQGDAPADGHGQPKSRPDPDVGPPAGSDLITSLILPGQPGAPTSNQPIASAAAQAEDQHQHVAGSPASSNPHLHMSSSYMSPHPWNQMVGISPNPYNPYNLANAGQPQHQYGGNYQHPYGGQYQYPYGGQHQHPYGGQQQHPYSGQYQHQHNPMQYAQQPVTPGSASTSPHGLSAPAATNPFDHTTNGTIWDRYSWASITGHTNKHTMLRGGGSMGQEKGHTTPAGMHAGVHNNRLQSFHPSGSDNFVSRVEDGEISETADEKKKRLRAERREKRVQRKADKALKSPNFAVPEMSGEKAPVDEAQDGKTSDAPDEKKRRRRATRKALKDQKEVENALKPQNPSASSESNVNNSRKAKVSAPVKGRQPPAPQPAPQPAPGYLAKAAETLRTTRLHQRLLIILDLNGTLVHRPNKKRPKQIIRRPYLEQFFQHIFVEHSVMVWSSARHENVQSMVEQVLKPSQMNELVAIWGREHLGLSFADFVNHVQVYKRLHRVWVDTGIQRRHPEYELGERWGQHNTVLIDDSLIKASSEPYNLIQVPEFTGQAAQMQSDVLCEVSNYLDILKLCRNVSAYIKFNPFKVHESASSSSDHDRTDDSIHLDAESAIV